MGAALPGPLLTTPDLIALMATRFDFLRARDARSAARWLGIDSRHVCRPFVARGEAARAGQANPDLAAAAVGEALGQAGLAPDDLAYLIGHTATPMQSLPANITLVADRLGYGGPHVELRQACTGFANALMIAFGLIGAGGGPVAIVGSETGSLFLDPTDLDGDTDQIINLMQMGDGAGAIILGAPIEGRPSNSAAWYGTLGPGRPAGISRQTASARFVHDYAAIREFGSLLFEAGAAMATERDCPVERADRIVPHQASGHIGTQMAAHFGIPVARTFVNADRIGNTGSAAIWLALAALRRDLLDAGARVLVLGAEASKYMYGGLVYEHA